MKTIHCVLNGIKRVLFDAPGIAVLPASSMSVVFSRGDKHILLGGEQMPVMHVMPVARDGKPAIGVRHNIPSLS